MLVRSKAPLRIGLAGGGTDVSPYCDTYGGYILNATINMYAYCTLETGEHIKNIVLDAKDRQEIYECELNSYIEIDGCLPLHKGIYNRIIRQFNNDKPLPIRITTFSDAPAGSGLGSSSTMVVAILKAFVELLNLPLGEYDIAHLAYEIERIDLKLSGGKQDQYAATFGGFNFIEFYADDKVIVNPLRIKNWIINELESSMILYYTGTSRDSARIIEEQIENTSSKDKKPLEAMHELKKSSMEMKEALLKGNIDWMANCMNDSWESKKRTSKVITNKKIDDIYRTAITSGAKAGKVSGAGGGGFMFFICDPVKKLDLIRALSKFEGKVYEPSFTKNGTQAWIIYD